MLKNILLALLIILATGGFCFWSFNYFTTNATETLIKAGPVGDAFAGLTAPIINLASVILIFFSFKMQLDANKIQKDALENEIKKANTLKELDQIIGLLEDVRQQISQFEIESMYDYEGNSLHKIKTFSGIEAVRYAKYVDNESDYQKFHSDYYSIMDLMLFIFEKTESYQFDFRDKRVIYEKIRVIFPPILFIEMSRFIDTINKYPNNVAVNSCRKFITRGHKKIEKYLLSYSKELQELLKEDTTNGIIKNDSVLI